MSDDLISRKAAVELVIAEYDSFQANGGSHSGRYELDKVIKMIQNMPTAFDKEKVVNELMIRATISEERMNLFAEKGFTQNESLADGKARAYRSAIEIVEKGGVG